MTNESQMAGEERADGSPVCVRYTREPSLMHQALTAHDSAHRAGPTRLMFNILGLREVDAQDREPA